MNESRIIERQKPFKIAYITSDLHWMDGSVRDDFLIHAGKFARSLCQIPRTAEIILVGDIADHWRVKKYWEIYTSYKDILELLRQYKTTWIIGNHEDRLEDVRDNVPPEIMLCNRLIWNGWYMCHGHEFDIFNKQNHGIGWAATKVVSAIGKASPSLEDKIAEFPNWIYKIGRHSDKDKVVKTCEAYIEHFCQVRGIIIGHLHEFMHEKILGRKEFICTGQWQKNGWLIFKDGEFINCQGKENSNEPD